MKNKATAIVDIDGVVCDFESAVCDAFGHKNRHLYKLEDRYPQYDPSLIVEWVNSEENYLNLSPIFGGILLISQLKQRGFDVILMTARGKHLETVTRSWLTLYHIEPDYLFFNPDKGQCIKGWNRYAKDVDELVPVTLFVDDSVSQLEQVKKLNPSVTCLAWSQPWNGGYFPRLRYNGTNYQIEANVGLGEWRWMWEK